MRLTNLTEWMAGPVASEIDAVIELENGDWTAIEIKLGANQEEEASAGLLAIRDDIAR